MTKLGGLSNDERRLGMSEGEANRRIAAARVVRQFPLAREYLERGAIHLCAVYELHKHLTEENHDELLREASGKSTKAVAELIAARFPKPDVHPCIEPLAPQPTLGGAMTAMSSSDAAVAPAPVTPQVVARPKVEPLSATRYRGELSVSAETKAKLERITDLMRHRNPTGDLEKILDASLDLLLTTLEKERLGKASRPKVKKGGPITDRTAAVDAPTTEADVADEADIAREGKAERDETVRRHNESARSRPRHSLCRCRSTSWRAVSARSVSASPRCAGPWHDFRRRSTLRYPPRRSSVKRSGFSPRRTSDLWRDDGFDRQSHVDQPSEGLAHARGDHDRGVTVVTANAR